MTSRPRHRWLKIALVQVVMIAIMLLAGELVVRWFVDPTRFFFVKALVPSPDNCLERSASVGMRFAANCSGFHSGVPFHTNELGLRGDPIPADGATRILAIGDSCTFGWKVAEGEAYPQALQQRLDERFGANRYRVINAGVPGYTSHQGLRYLRDEGLALDPKIVILAYGFNDAIRKGDVEQALAQNRRMLPVLEVSDWLFNRFALWRWAYEKLAADGGEREVRVEPERYKQNLAAMIDEIRAHGAAPVMVIFPLGLLSPYTHLARVVAEEKEVPMLSYDGPKLDVIHPTKEGYATLSDELMTTLEQAGYLPSP